MADPTVHRAQTMAGTTEAGPSVAAEGLGPKNCTAAREAPCGSKALCLRIHERAPVRSWESACAFMRGCLCTLEE